MLKYIWAKLLKKLPGSSLRNVIFETPSRAEAQCTIINSSFGRYSYCGYYCSVFNCQIGRFTSIADKVVIGNAGHPIDWVSTSPAFYKGRDGLPKNLAQLDYNSYQKRTVIGNDVWIGEGAYIKEGITIGDGAIVGMGSVVTKDVPPYAIVAGNPARLIRMRFSETIIHDLEEIKWWELEIKEIEKLSHLFSRPDELIEKVKKHKLTQNDI